ncbi:hypothetical protein [Tenacibaculum piscium]|uniref:hypothetical protein n=1 Tax=Tenacibaculum piscium TaxID=1458515 RepID=UPI001F3856DB|nr:hypothetical protein [Tenacibaculum piscium]
MNLRYFFTFIIAFIFCFSSSLNGFSQHKFATYTAHQSITEAITLSDKMILGRTLFFEKQAQEKPLMFQHTSVKIGQLNRLSNNVSKYIEELQNQVNTEQILYEMLAENHYKNLLFANDKTLSFKGNQLKIKIDSLYNYAVKINGHQLSQLENFYKGHFKTDTIFYDFDEHELNYFEYLFFDTSNYGIMMAMNCLLLDVKTFQLLYFGTVMSY